MSFAHEGVLRFQRALVTLLALILLGAPTVVVAEDSAAPGNAVSAKLERTREILLNSNEEQHAAGGDAKTAGLGDKSESGSVLKMVQALGICIGLLLVFLFVVKKFNPKMGLNATGRRIRILERITVAPRTSLVLTELDGNKILFAVGSDRVTLLRADREDFQFEPEVEKLESAV